MTSRKALLIPELPELRADNQLPPFAFLDAADDLRVDVERLGDGNDFLGVLRREVDLQAMSHVEHLVHLVPLRAALLLDGSVV